MSETDESLSNIDRLRMHASMNPNEFDFWVNDIAADMDHLRASVAELEAKQERMWCESCGTVTRTAQCDCTKMETGTQRLVNYADSSNDEARRLCARVADLEDALRDILECPKIRSLCGWYEEMKDARTVLNAGEVPDDRQAPPEDHRYALSSLRNAIIANTKGDLFWIGEILLGELEKETGFAGEAPGPEPRSPAGAVTDEMVERAAEAMMAEMFAPHELPTSEALQIRYRETARATLTAALSGAPR